MRTISCLIVLLAVLVIYPVAANAQCKNGQCQIRQPVRNTVKAVAHAQPVRRIVKARPFKGIRERAKARREARRERRRNRRGR
jgi:hypothetical protein